MIVRSGMTMLFRVDAERFSRASSRSNAVTTALSILLSGHDPKRGSRYASTFFMYPMCVEGLSFGASVALYSSTASLKVISGFGGLSSLSSTWSGRKPFSAMVAGCGPDADPAPQTREDAGGRVAAHGDLREPVERSVWLAVTVSSSGSAALPTRWIASLSSSLCARRFGEAGP